MSVKVELSAEAVATLVEKWRTRAVNCDAGILARKHIEGCANELYAALATAPPEQAVQVAGRMEQTFSEHTRRLGLLIAEEQEKPLPNNALIAALCDSIRLAREATVAIADPPQAASAGALEDLIAAWFDKPKSLKGETEYDEGCAVTYVCCAADLKAALAAHDQKVREQAKDELIMRHRCGCETCTHTSELCPATKSSIAMERTSLEQHDQKVRAETLVLEEAMLEEMAMYIALRLPEGLPLRGDRNEAKHVILRLMRAAAPAASKPEAPRRDNQGAERE